MSTTTPVATRPSTDEAELPARCADVVSRARRAGADEAEAYATRSESVSVTFEKGDLKGAQVDESAALGLRVCCDKRLGFMSTNQLGDAAFQSAARDAIDVARCSLPDPHNELCDPTPISGAALPIDRALLALSASEVVDIGASLAARARAFDRRISIDSATCSWSRMTRAVHSSRGVDAVESDCVLSLQIMGMAIDGDDVGGIHYSGDVVRRRADVAGAVERTVLDFARVAVENLGAARAESYSGPVLFAPEAFLSVFVSPVIGAASALAVQRGRSFLAGRVGEAIAQPCFHVIDDPTDLDLAGARRFDREGAPAARFTLVEHGKLASYMYNGYAARVEGRTSTGHASGGARSVPGLGVHAPVVLPGDGGDEAALCARVGRGLYVQRFSGTVDPASGDFSGVAKSARWIEGGRPVRSVRETLLSGNAFALLHRILALSSTSKRSMGGSRAPWALVDGVKVTAG
ncbi:MAG: TldD/PmbA family protein [Planctomycetota bacterium]